MKIIDKFKEGVSWITLNIPYGDKVLHFVSGLIVSILILAITGASFYGFAGAFVIGLLKEAYDNYKAKKAVGSYLDWFITILGGILGELMFL